MDRREITKRLSEILIHDRLSGIGKYYAREVVLDYGTKNPKRIDFLQYIPNGASYVGDIENGRFIGYEVKSCREDFYSGSGLNFVCDTNIVVTTVECYKSLIPDIGSGKMQEHVKNMNDGRSAAFSFLLAVPDSSCERFNSSKAIAEEIEHPTPLDGYDRWRLASLHIGQAKGHRVRSTTELLFCMVRSGR